MYQEGGTRQQAAAGAVGNGNDDNIDDVHFEGIVLRGLVVVLPPLCSLDVEFYDAGIILSKLMSDGQVLSQEGGLVGRRRRPQASSI